MTYLRCLTSDGLHRMSGFLDSLTTDSPLPYPSDALTEDPWSQPVSPEIQVEPRSFRSRIEAAEYIYNRIHSIVSEEQEHSAGLWGWMTLFWLDAVCPVRSDGRRRPGQRARLFPLLGSWNTYYRHLLFGPYAIYGAYAYRPGQALALLCQPVDRPGDVVEQIASRQRLVSSPAVVGAATKLYVGENRSIRAGAAGKGPGSARRFADVVMQLDLNYDLHSMTVDELITLLPREFQRDR